MRWKLAAIVALCAVLVVAGMFATRSCDRAVATAQASAPVEGGIVLVETSTWAVRSSPVSAQVNAALAPLGIESSSPSGGVWLTDDEVSALTAALDSLRAARLARRSGASGVTQASGHEVGIGLGEQTVGPAGAMIAHHDLNVEFRPTLLESGAMTIEARVTTQTADGPLVMQLQDLGVPIATRKMSETFVGTGPDGAAVLWVPRGTEAWLLIIHASPMPQRPAPATIAEDADEAG